MGTRRLLFHMQKPQGSVFFCQHSQHNGRYMSYQASGPSSESTTWERGAIATKNEDFSNPYMEAIRAEHDPAQHIKTIEDELKGTIGKALGRQGAKILLAMKRCDEEFANFERLKKNMSETRDVLEESVERFNQHRADAIKARWELTVHRQAAGFIVNNHDYVAKQYPIPKALSLQAKEENTVDKVDESAEPSKENHRGQLDWWQRIGRWK